jgi:anti-sigma factor RsiW
MREDIVNDLTAYIDGELPPARAAEVAAALAADPQLKALEAKLRATVVALKGLPDPDPSLSLRRKVLALVDEPTWKERLAKWLTPPRLVPVGLAVAAAVTAVVLWPGQPVVVEGLDEDALLVAQNLELAEDLDLIGLESPDDLAVVAQLDELEVVQ